MEHELTKMNLFNGTPRDPDRIDVVLKTLQKAWERFPDMRLMQLLEVIIVHHDKFNKDRDTNFYVEDTHLIHAIEGFIKANERKNNNTTENDISGRFKE